MKVKTKPAGNTAIGVSFSQFSGMRTRESFEKLIVTDQFEMTKQQENMEKNVLRFKLRIFQRFVCVL